ncbi:MAG: o-succinylbenzoate synthase, partial [Pirellulales bacterium]|nr:o-succinylbenzoate synthase [Pirellulales bacterium]
VELKLRPGWDVHMLNAVRQEFPVETFHTDIEGTMRLDHMELLCRMDDFSMAMVEQPLPPDDLVGHAMVQEAIRTPICLDEAITTEEQADIALELHSCRYVNIRAGRVGGITPAVGIHDACQDARVPCRAGATPQSAIGARAGLALATKANFNYPVDYFPSQDVFQQDLAESLATVKDASDGKLRVSLWSEAGLGVEPNAELLESLAINHARIETNDEMRDE